ncbi:MAG: 2-amino-4-hydroxy-6-hydroxymethyldihydropteridine diphosphokinase [Spirochaetales bacterium]|nr:2-amino-4-hydroxy-6-hydroxymethyldihydropteridine diphosphokinase [Spirochaetales bacterium]
MQRVYIGAGSNMGDRLSHLRYARERLGAVLEDFRVSRVYETAPRDYFEQDHFYNCVFSGLLPGTAGGGSDGASGGAAALDEPERFLELLLGIEKEAGRVREGAIPKGPRVLDLDMLLWGDKTIRSERLTVPHPAMKERAFVLVPLLELDEGLIESGTGILYADCLKPLEDQEVRPVDFSRGMW